MSAEYKPTNIDCFNIITVHILADLHASFPKPFDIRADEYQNALVEERELHESCSLFYGDQPADGCSVSSSLDYLIDEGLVRCKSTHSNVFYDGAVLTSKGFSVLSQPVANQSSSSETIGSKLQTMKEHASKAVVSSAVGQIFKLLF